MKREEHLGVCGYCGKRGKVKPVLTKSGQPMSWGPRGGQISICKECERTQGMRVLTFPLDHVVVDSRVRDWCKLPYPGHSKGCPNYSKKLGCPPERPLFASLIETPFTLVAVSFNLGAWAEQMKEKHPEWSDRQARCCLYWQGKVRKRLRQACERLVTEDDLVLYTPEATGVNVFETCRTVGLILKRNPQDIVWKVAIIGRLVTC